MQIEILPCLEETCNLPAFVTVETREFSYEDAQIADIVSKGRASAMSSAVRNGGRWRFVHVGKRTCDLPAFALMYLEGDAKIADMAIEDRAPAMSLMSSPVRNGGRWRFVHV